VNIFDERDATGDDESAELVSDVLGLAAEHMKANKLSRDELARRRQRVERAASATTQHAEEDLSRETAKAFAELTAGLESVDADRSPEAETGDRLWFGAPGSSLTPHRVGSSTGGSAQAVAVMISTEKGRRIVGSERQTLARDLVSRYTSGSSIRALAADTGRSYGFVHRVLTEAGVELRQRGGARRRKKA